MPLLMSPNHNGHRRHGLSAIVWKGGSAKQCKIASHDDETTDSSNSFSPKRNVEFSEDHLVSVAHMYADVETKNEENKKRWYQEDDYLMFEKDRVLTCFEYRSMMQSVANFKENGEHTMRGLESVHNNKLRRRLSGQKKDLLIALKAEEAHQKQGGNFPDLERFRVVSLRHTKGARDRALSLAAEDAKETHGKPKSGWRRKFIISSAH